MSDSNVLRSLNLNKVILPMILGLAVVGYLMFTQVDFEMIRNIDWKGEQLVWLLIGILCYVFRHLFYAWRLRIVSINFFSWIKSIELIFIWEFSSAISPTSVGGSAVALFLLAQEKLSGAKTVSLVVYTAILDGLFFILTLIAMFLLLGPIIIRPEMHSMHDIDGYGRTFYVLLVVMAGYSFLFFYGVFINPIHFKKLLLWLSKLSILKRFKTGLKKNAYEIETTSKTLLAQGWKFHLLSFISTSGAWIMRFLAINFFILAIQPSAIIDLYHHLIVYARGETMYVITSFSPTPGASGVAEYLFAGFYDDYIPKDFAIVVAMVWRLVSYYFYLIIGMFIVPNWIRKVINRRSENHLN